MDHVMLRDHGEKMLQAIALDLRKPESEKQQADKSKGEAAGKNDETAAKVHGQDRLALGFTLNSAVAEYRALRASVLRTCGQDASCARCGHVALSTGKPDG
jgi:hypothetical protein